MITVGIMLGLASAVGLSFLMHSFDDTVKTHEDVDSFSVPLLAGVPRIGFKDTAQNARVLEIEPHSVCAEAFRNLRTSITLMPNAKDASPLLVTSTAPGEGKSVVAANLGIAFARNNQRTLLIDADMHRPVLHNVFRVPNDRGLSLYLTNGCSLQDVVRETDIANLDVITVGSLPPNPPELLGSGRMTELLAEARKYYERVVIDSPPVTAVSDPLILLPHVQGVIFVIGFSKIRREIVERTMQKLRDCGAPLIGVVMNNIELKMQGYGYYPYRYSDYQKPKR